MLKLTDELIDGTINGISGFISANASKKYNISLEKALELFLCSETYNALSNKENHFYSDSIPELQEMFFKELELSKNLK